MTGKGKQAKMEPKEDEARWRTIMDHSRQFIGVTSIDGTLIDVNQAALELVGASAAAVLNKPFWDTPWWSHSAVLREQLRAAIRTAAAGEPVHFEAMHLAADGTRRHVDFSLQPVKDERGRVLFLVSEGNDITERKRAEEALCQSRDVLDQVLNTIPQSVFWKDRDSQYLGCNLQFARAVGLEDPDKIVGKTDFDLPWPRADAEAYRSDDRFVIDKNCPKPHIIEPLQQADGSRLWIDTSKMPLVGGQGNVYGVLGVYEDITARKKAEEETRIFMESVGSSSDAVGMSTPEGKHYYQNHAFDELFGPVGEEPPESVYVDPNVGHEVFRAIMAGGQWTGEVQMYAKDRRILDILLRAYANKDADGRITALVGIHTDITARKRAEEVLLLRDRAIASSINAIVIADLGGSITYVNDAFTRMWGYSAAEASGMPVTRLGSSYEEVARFVSQFRIQGHGIGESIARRNDGSLFHIQVSGSLVFNEAGEPTAMLSSFIDITERKKAEAALKESEERYRSFVTNATEGIYRIDFTPPVPIDLPERELIARLAQNAIVGEVNEHLARMHGLSASDMIGRLATDFAPTYGERALLAVRAPNFQVSDQETQDVDLAGQVVLLLENFTGVVEEGRLTHIWGMQRDITERKAAEEALAGSRRMLELVINNIPQFIFWKDRNSIYQGCNTNFARVAGVASPDDIVGKTDYDFAWRKEEADFFRECDERVMTSGVAEYHIIEPQLQSDGKQAWLDTNKVPLFDDAGNVVGILGTYEDITGRKQAEEALRRSEANLQAIMANTSDIIASYDREVRLVAYNAACSEVYRHLFGVEIHTGLRTLDLFPQSMRGFWMTNNTRALAGESFSIEFEVPAADAGRRVFESSFHPIREGTDVVGFSTTTRDITERKGAEEALCESERRYRELVTHANSVILRMDAEGRIFFFNEFAQRLFGYTEEEVLGRNVVGTIVPETDRVGRDLRRMILDIARQPSLYAQNENENIRRDGSRVWISWTNTPVLNAEGEIFEILCIGNDITARKQAEEERERLQSQLSQAQKMESVGRLAGGVAHDFNNMLGVILGHTEMALEQVAPEDPLHAELEEVQKAAQRSADLTRQLLAFARKQTVAPKVLDLNESVAGMLTLLRRLIGEDIDLLWKPGHEMWPVKMDPTQLNQILANLCVNARDAIAGVGKVTIETDNASFDEDCCVNHEGFVPGDYVLLAVSDDGCGMDVETVSHIFEPFFTTKEMGKGTGLGLATVYGVIRQNSGFINVYSEPSQGTTFRIYLPRHAAKAAQETEELKPQAPARGGETILLVEDEPAILSMTKTFLERLGYAVLAANTPGDAIRLAGEHSAPIDLVMTDVVMPEMNGRDLAKKLLAIYPDIRRLFMSGYTADVIVHHGVLDEDVHFIQKPFSMKDLAAKIREALKEE